MREFDLDSFLPWLKPLNNGGRTWAPWEEQLLRKFYAVARTEDIATVLGSSTYRVYQKAVKLGLHKCREVIVAMARAGTEDPNHPSRAYRFQKGNVPANKGTRRPGWAPGRMSTTQFKKGRAASEARNYVPIGNLRLSKDGYLERKVTDDPTLVPARRWVAVHRLVWMEANGPVPAGQIVAFKQGRRTNELALITLDALELLSLRENMVRNSVHRWGPEVFSAIQARGALNRQLNCRAKEGASHE